MEGSDIKKWFRGKMNERYNWFEYIHKINICNVNVNDNSFIKWAFTS